MATGPTTFAVAHPERWWRVMRSEVDIPRDKRWAGAPPLKWERIAYAVEDLGRDLVTGAYEVDEDGKAILEMHRPLEEPELRIVKS